MSDLWTSREKARKRAKEIGGKVVDLGKGLPVRWAVVPKDPAEKVADTYVQTVSNKTVVISSKFFKTRQEAREFAKGVKNPVTIDHAKTPDGKDKGETVIKDLSRHGERWEVVFEKESTVASEEDMKIYRSISDNYREAISKCEAAAVGNDGEDKKEEPIIIITPGNLSITTADGETFPVSRQDDIFKEVMQMISDNDTDGAIALIKQGIKADVVVDLGDELKVLDGSLYWYGIKQESSIAKRILSDIEAGTFDERYAKFMTKLMHNPSYKAVEMLYDFLEENHFKILEDGNFEAFKGVQKTENGWRDWKTGLVPNYIGMVVSMPRNMVEDNPSISCSYGLHIGPFDYAQNYGTVLTVSVDPADVVSVPYNYENRKCRCCRYTVLDGPEERPVHIPPVLVVGKKGEWLEGVWLD